MRNDMSKVIVERPRIADRSNDRRARAGNMLPDQLPSLEGMRAKHVRRGGGKQLNENLRPLQRFLASRVGLPWDDIYSEISQNLRSSNTVQQHVKDHLFDFVDINTVMRDGVIYVNASYSGPFPVESSHRDFYVDPTDGTLKQNEWRVSWSKRHRLRSKQEAACLAATRRTLPDGTILRKADGIWYEVTMGDLPPLIKRTMARPDGSAYQTSVGGEAYDVIEQRWMSRTVYKNGPTSFCKTKRQLSSAELRRWGLENG